LKIIGFSTAANIEELLIKLNYCILDSFSDAKVIKRDTQLLFKMQSSKISKLEEKALKLLLKYEDKGLLQSELWHKLGVTSRDGSRIAIKLEKRGLIKRVKEFANDRWTRRLVPLVKPFDISVLEGSPCPSCQYNNNCGPGQTYSPTNCVLIENWLMLESLSQEKSAVPINVEEKKPSI
jgi:hypothetical protein